ncbi:MAG TPA: Crp/Fnr family transcriptional regulator [Terriglobia bacterium]|nr:Crp/Fnr family transcriptional regulator [Terriglobia bacterium]
MDTHEGLTIDEIFGGLTPKTLRDFQALGHMSAYLPGMVLFAGGEACAGIFWVISGQVRISTYDAAGRCVVARAAHIGELLGLYEALCAEAYETTAQVEEPSEVSFVSRADFWDFLSSHSDAAFRIVQHLGNRVDLALSQLRLASTLKPPKPPN